MILFITGIDSAFMTKFAKRANTNEKSPPDAPSNNVIVLKMAEDIAPKMTL